MLVAQLSQQQEKGSWGEAVARAYVASSLVETFCIVSKQDKADTFEEGSTCDLLLFDSYESPIVQTCKLLEELQHQPNSLDVQTA